MVHLIRSFCHGGILVGNFVILSFRLILFFRGGLLSNMWVLCLDASNLILNRTQALASCE